MNGDGTCISNGSNLIAMTSKGARWMYPLLEALRKQCVCAACLSPCPCATVPSRPPAPFAGQALNH
eukprot:5596988-Alexandrium_andersonii.AAC.1